jgi:hypothetical protein
MLQLLQQGTRPLVAVPSEGRGQNCLSIALTLKLVIKSLEDGYNLSPLLLTYPIAMLISPKRMLIL